MIWLWIVTALVLSIIPLINKKIELPYYIWLLLPIDSYGLSVAGAIIKPYMLFALLLPIVAYAKNKGRNFDLSVSKRELAAGLVSFLIVTVNIINTDNLSSVKAAVMAMVVYVCVQCCVSSTDKKPSEQLADVFIASGFGCAVVYIVAFVCMKSGIDIPAIIADTRSDPGLMLKLADMVNGSYTEFFRLRGFAFDPNTLFIQFAFTISACTIRLFKKINFYYLFTLVISLLCVLMSSSRTGLICSVLCVVIASIVGISSFDSVKKKILSFLAVLSAGAGFLIVFMSEFGQKLIQTLLSSYSVRSSLTDKYGRFTIWNECVSVYWEKNPLFGIGINNMQNYTSTHRATHNTWLQFICECGIIVGVIACAYFIGIAIYGLCKISEKTKNEPNNDSFVALSIGYLATLIALISVDDINCCYLWFGALMILHLGSYSGAPDKSNTLQSKYL